MRWTLVCKAYREIQECIHCNGKVTRETTIQLPDVNQTTVSQWFIKREKKKEQETLKQGITPPHQEATSSQPLPAAVPLPPALPQVSFPFPFTFVLPDNTTGRATLRGPAPRCRPLQPKPVPPRGPVPIQPKQSQLQYHPNQLKSSKMKAAAKSVIVPCMNLFPLWKGPTPYNSSTVLWELVLPDHDD